MLVASNGWAGKGVYIHAVLPLPPKGFRHRALCAQNPRGGNSHAVHLFPLSSSPRTLPLPFLSQPPFLFLSLSSSFSTVSSARFCGNPSGTFSYRYPAILVESEDSQATADRNNSWPVVFGLRAYRVVQSSSESPWNIPEYDSGYIVASRNRTRILRRCEIFRTIRYGPRLFFAAYKVPNIVFKPKIFFMLISSRLTLRVHWRERKELKKKLRYYARKILCLKLCDRDRKNVRRD